MPDFEFKLEDFDFGISEVSMLHSRLALQRANAKLKEWLDKAPVVYAAHPTSMTEWFPYKLNSDTHKAKLVCIEEIK